MSRSAPLIKSKIKLTRKQKAFADALINNPKLSATRAALQTYGTPEKPPTYQTAQQLSHENLTKPNIQLYLDEHVQKAKNRVVELIDSKKEDIALRASDSILDRTLGKATQRTEVTSISMSFGMDLTDQLETENP